MYPYIILTVGGLLARMRIVLFIKSGHTFSMLIKSGHTLFSKSPERSYGLFLPLGIVHATNY